MGRINNQMLGVTGLSLCVQMEQQNLSTAVAVSFPSLSSKECNTQQVSNLVPDLRGANS